MQNFSVPGEKRETAGEILRFWRQQNRISQLDLALDVGVSAKHISFVETGKSRPSRSLILKLANTLKLPFRYRNALLAAAGYAAEFGEESFDGPKMEIVRQALERLLTNHEPYPAFVVNKGYKILMINSGFERIVAFYLGEEALDRYDNVYRMTFAEDGLRPYIENWPLIEHFMLGRLWEEMVSSQHGGLFALYAEISQMCAGGDRLQVRIDDRLPVMSLTLKKDATRTSFFTTIATLGTPLDLTTQELRIELLFPSDEETKGFFPSSPPGRHPKDRDPQGKARSRSGRLDNPASADLPR